MKKNIMIAVGSFVLGSALFVGLTGTMAANTNGNGQVNGIGLRSGSTITEEQREAIGAAVEAGDYQAWKALHEGIDNEITQKVNEGNFARFAEAQKLMIQNRTNMESARVIMEELGIERGFGKGGQGKGIGGPRGVGSGDCPCQNGNAVTE